MDNQIFPTGQYIDDLPQVCTLCGMLFNNAISLQHHMQLHILTAATANQLLGNQPPDPGLGLNPAPSIMDLVAGTSPLVVPSASTQHVASGAGAQLVVVPGSSSNNPLIPAQALFTTNSAASVPSHLIPQSLGKASSLSTALPQKSKDKKGKAAMSKVTGLNMSAGISISTSPSVRNSIPSTIRSQVSRPPHQSHDTSSSTYISTFPADLQKMDLTPPAKPTPQLSNSKEDLEPFLPTLSQIDPIEEALKEPAFSKVSQFDRVNSSTVLSSSHGSQNKDQKLFQPFVTTEEPPSLSFMSKSNTVFTADSLLSPVKTGPDKPIDLDILSTPQKPSYSSLQGNDSLSSSPKPLPNVPLKSDLRHFARGKTQDSADYNSNGDNLKDMPTVKVSQSAVDSIPGKPPFYPGLIDPLNISPKSSQLYRDNKSGNVPAKVLPAPPYKSSSPELKTSISIASEPPGVPKDPAVPMLSPTLSVDIASTSVAPNSVTTASKPPLYGNGDDVQSGIPQVFGSSKAGPQVSAAPVVMNPAVGMTDVTNPLGTGYFNALTQKLLNPGLSIGTEFNKPNTSSFNYGSDNQGQKGKSYYENGILINQDYDKISDTNDEEDLEKLIDDIDTKDDNIDSKGYTACSEIEDLLNEFNEKHPEDLSKNKSQMDDFLNDVLNENIRMKLDERNEDPVPSAEDMAMNQIAISELLEKEKEKIDEESKMLECARLNASGGGNSEAQAVESEIITSTQSSTTTTTTTTTATTATSVNQAPSADPSTSAIKSDTKEDDPTDFDIPKVGKLMKIRKYFQIQEQKKKEKTQNEKEADAEVKIQIREKEPIAEKPQTILVQVSKRKKLEYGPYINRQSLLEGKPKEPEQETSPPKVFRPKPKPPQVPTRRTFNLRTRKTKTDFASLANKGSKTPEVKKTTDKATDDKSQTSSPNEESKTSLPDEESNEEAKKNTSDEGETPEIGITTRNKDKAKKEAESGQKQILIDKVIRKGKDSPNKSDSEKDTKKEDGKPNLRTRSSKVENDENSTDTKNLRKRTSKSPADSSKTKVSKTDTKCAKSDHDEKIVKAEEKTIKIVKAEEKTIKIVKAEEKTIKISLRNKDNKDAKETKDNKDVKKKTPEKAEIKMCSVNLGENLTESKIKAATSCAVQNIKKGKFKQAIDKVEDKKSTATANEKQSAPESNKKENLEVDPGKPELKLSTNDTDEVKKESVKTERNANEVVSDPVGTDVPKSDEAEIKHDLEKNDNSASVTISISEVANVDESVSKKDNKSTETTSNCEDEHQAKIKQEPAVLKVEPVREKLTMKFKLGANLASIMKDIPKPKKRKLASSPKVESIVIKEETAKADEKSVALDSPDGTVFEPPAKMEKKMKHSVENEFQRLVDEAMAEVKNAQKNDSGKQERSVNLRKRLNDGVKYNVDDSDDELDPRTEFLLHPDKHFVKTGTCGPKSVKTLGKGACKIVNKSPVLDIKPKKDMDIYDFTDTELSDKEDTTPAKTLSFKPKYVSNLKLFGQNKIPFVSKPITPPSTSNTDTENKAEAESKNETEEERLESENDHNESEISYVGLSVEPLKIKLSKIIPYKEKRHKHKKKKRKRDKERKHGHDRDEDNLELLRSEMEIKSDEIKNVEAVTADSDSNEGQEEDMIGNPVTRNAKKPKLKEKKHICVFCNQGFGQKCDLRKHVMIHTGERPWPCEICDKRFQRKTDLVKHTRTHTGEKPYACEFCDKRVSDKSQLSVHRRLHTGDRPYQCTKCGKRCITSSELTRHRSVRCSEKPHQCELCKKTFKIKECLGMHMKMHYRSKGKLFQCDKCAVGFDRKSDMENHSCAIWSNSLYICSECYEEFSDELVYAEHIKTHDLGVFSCNMCTNIFEDKHSLETHLCSMGIEKLRPFQCEICDEVFQDQNALSQHVPIHDNDAGSFMCELCPEIFSLRKDFISHVKKHKDDNHLTTEMTGADDISKVSRSVLKGVNEVINVESPEPHVTENTKSSSVKVEKGVVERASVISNTFRQVDSGNSSLHRRGLGNSVSKKSYQCSMSGSGLRVNIGKTNGRPTPIKADVLNSDKIFEASDFTNSPDFSSLTEESDLSMNPFEKLGSTSESQGQDSHGHSVNRKVNSSFGGADNQRGNVGFGGSLEHSMKEDQKSSKSYPSVTSSLHGPADSAQTYSWTGSYQISANEYVDSLLNKMGPGQAILAPSDLPSNSKSSSIKVENHESGVSKSTGILSPSSRGDLYKDNIENRSKSEFFSEFDFQIGPKSDTFQGSVQTKALSQQKYSNSGARENTAFQGIDQNSYSLSRNRHFPESSPFSNSFMTSFQQNNSIYNSGNSNLFGSGTSDLISKRGTSSGIFGGNQDMLQSNFYLGVEESLKGTSPNDKTDETTALLSNFDYGIN